MVEFIYNGQKLRHLWGRGEEGMDGWMEGRIFGGKFGYTVFAGPASSELGTVNQGREWTLASGKQCAAWRRHCRVYAPQGAALWPTSRFSVRSPLWGRKGRGRRKMGGGEGYPINYMGNCARIIYVRIYTDTGCTRPRHTSLRRVIDGPTKRT